MEPRRPVDCLGPVLSSKLGPQGTSGAVEAGLRHRGEGPSAASPGEHGSCACGHHGSPRPVDPGRDHGRHRAFGSDGGEPVDRARETRSPRASSGTARRREGAARDRGAVQRAVRSRRRPRVRCGHDPPRDRGPDRRDARRDRGDDARGERPRAAPLLDERPDPVSAFDAGVPRGRGAARRHRGLAGSGGPRAGNGRGPDARFPELGGPAGGVVPRAAGRSPRGRGERRPAGRSRRALAGRRPGSRHLRLHLPGSGHRRRDPRRGRAAPRPSLACRRDRGHVHGVRVPEPGLRDAAAAWRPSWVSTGSCVAGNRRRAGS